MKNVQRQEAESAGWVSNHKYSVPDYLLVGAAFLSIFVAQSSLADFQLNTERVRLEDVRISAGNIGDDARVKFLITNNGHTPLQLRGISSLASDNSRFEIKISNKKHISAEVLSIPPNETLDFQTLHQRIFLSQLTMKLVPGQELDIKFHFLQGDIDVIAHVH